MNNKLLRDIKNYITFLQKCGYSVSVSSFGDNFYPFTESLLQNEIHLHAVCTFLKSNPTTIGKCSICKQKLQECKIRKITYISCYAGVEEYIFPVYYKEKRIVCIHLSGYRNNINRSFRQMQKTAKICPEQFATLYENLSDSPPDKKLAKSFISPLIYMFTELYIVCKTLAPTNQAISPAERIYIEALQYINDNYMNNISAQTIATVIGYSVSYLRSVFKKQSGCSLQDKINEVRLENARFLLSNSSMSVTDVAFNCGFADSNYFSVVFKKRYGKSPRDYKKTIE